MGSAGGGGGGAGRVVSNLAFSGVGSGDERSLIGGGTCKVDSPEGGIS